MFSFQFLYEHPKALETIGWTSLCAKGDSGTTTGASLKADNSLYGLNMTESPEGERLLDIDQFFTHFIGVPMLGWVVINGFEDGNQV